MGRSRRRSSAVPLEPPPVYKQLAEVIAESDLEWNHMFMRLQNTTVEQVAEEFQYSITRFYRILIYRIKEKMRDANYSFDEAAAVFNIPHHHVICMLNAIL